MAFRKTLAACAISALLAPAMASATEPGFYVGGKVGAASTDERWIDDDDTSFGVYLGYRFTPHFAIEGEYTDFGNLQVNLSELEINNPRLEPRTWGIRALGFLPISDSFELLGGVGMHSFDLDPRDEQGFRDVVGSKSSTDLFYGVGGQFNFQGGLSLRAQYQRYELKQAGSSDEVSLGLHYRF